MKIRIAVAGLRHGHILEVFHLAKEHAEVEIVACAEEHEPTRDALAGQVRITHRDPVQMMDEVDCEVVAIGDYYGRRGRLAIEALKRGRHVLSDKPLATSLAEVVEIAALAREAGLAVGCQLSMPSNPNFVRLREVVRQGLLGEINQIAFGGQHPLNHGSRPSWYFEPDKHGGTFNDIAVHAFHLIPWLTGLALDRIVAARTWSTATCPAPGFPDAAQCMLTLSNGAGVLGDVSYSMPSTLGYKLPQYWRVTLFGDQGMAETSARMDPVTVVRHAETEPRTLPGLASAEPDYFESFLSEVRGEPERAALSTADVLRASALALQVQAYADTAGHDPGQALTWPMGSGNEGTGIGRRKAKP